MESSIAKKRAIIRGHEFHYSTTECNRDVRFVYGLRRSKGIFEGMGLWSINSMASYMHTHPAFLSQSLHYPAFYILSTLKTDTMSMSKKIMERKERDRKEKITELEKMASAGSGDAKKKLAKEKRKLK